MNFILKGASHIKYFTFRFWSFSLFEEKSCCCFIWFYLFIFKLPSFLWHLSFILFYFIDLFWSSWERFWFLQKIQSLKVTSSMIPPRLFLNKQTGSDRGSVLVLTSSCARPPADWWTSPQLIVELWFWQNQGLQAGKGRAHLQVTLTHLRSLLLINLQGGASNTTSCQDKTNQQEEKKKH